MRRYLNKEELYLIAVVFWVTVLLIRSVLFFVETQWSYQYILGFGMFGVAVILYWLHGRTRTFFQLSAFGIGVGFLFDSATLWLPGFTHPGSYWMFGNFAALVAVGFVLSVLPHIRKDPPRVALLEARQQKHTNAPNPKISVVIPAFNEEPFLARTLASIAEQDFTDFELIIVDNNSDDNTALIAQRYGATVVHEPRAGVGYARQSGFMAAKADIIVTTDADTILPSHWLSTIWDHFQKDPQLVALGGLYQLYSGPLLARCCVFYFLYPAFVFEKRHLGGWSLSGVNLAVRKDAFLKVEGFDEQLTLCEDVELSQKIRKYGKVSLDPHLIAWTSGRRYRHGLMHGLLTYFPNALVRWLFRKPTKQKRLLRFPSVRHEGSLFRAFEPLPLIILVGILFVLFYFH